jgi:syntenin-1
VGKICLEIGSYKKKFQVNGQNVVGVKDKEIAQILDEGGPSVTVTVIPSYLYDHITKK